MSLAQYFSDQIKEDFAKRNINLGKTLLLKIEDFNINYKKYFIIAGKNDTTIAGVIINTEINKNFAWNETLQKLHIKIKQEEHQFLKYDSYIDCSKLQKKEINSIFQSIIKNPNIVVGNVTDDLLKQIKETIKNAPTISKKEKINFGFI